MGTRGRSRPAVAPLAVLAAAAVLLLAQFVGLTLGSVAANVAARTGGAPFGARDAASDIPFLLGAAALCVIGAAWSLARPRRRAGTSWIASVDGATTLVAAALLAAISGLGALVAGGGWGAAVTLVPAVCAAVGVLLARVPGRTRRGTASTPDAGPQRRVRFADEAGAIAAEQVAVVVVVAAIVAALFAASVPQKAGAWATYAACSLFTNGDCERPGGDDAGEEPVLVSPWLPDAPCVIARDTTGWETSLGVLVVSAGADSHYTVEQRSDGTWQVTWSNDGRVGAGANAGVAGSISTGDEDWGSGLYASADARVGVERSETWTLGSEQDALDWITWHDRMLSSSESLDTPLQYLNPMTWGGSNSITGRTQRWTSERANDVMNFFGAGLDEPPTPETVEIYHAGGTEGTANAYFGFLFAGDASAGADVATQIGWSELPQTGGRKYYFSFDGSLLLDAGLNTAAGAEGDLSISSVLAVTVDADGIPTSLDATFTTIGDAGQRFETISHPSDVLGSAWDGRGGDGGDNDRRTTSSLYEVQVSIPIGPGEEHLADLAANLGLTTYSAALTGGRSGFADELWEHGTIAVTEYTVDDRRYGAEAGVGLGIHVSGGVHKIDSGLSAQRTHFYDRDAGAYTPRMDCTLG